MTTSKLYKRQLAEAFCGMDATVLEVGVYHGHGTELLASVFAKVLALDIDRSALSIALQQVGRLSHRVTFLQMDSLAEDWALLAANNVSVVVIDGQHDYKNVLGDAENALRHLPDLRYLVFHDFWIPPVERVITELESEELISCRNIGLQNWDRHRKVYESFATKSEGKLCRKLAGLKASKLGVWKFMVFRVPLVQFPLRQVGLLHFQRRPRRLRSLPWGNGTWSFLNGSEEVVRIQLPRLARRPRLLALNADRSGFLLSGEDGAAEFFGMKEELIFRSFYKVNSLF